MSFRDAVLRRVPESWVKRWPTIRAVLVAYHVLAVVILSFPSPPSGMKHSTWENPTVQNEFRLWADRFSGVGVHITPAELDAKLWDLSGKIVAARETVTVPFLPYGNYLGPRQSWRMFVAPQRYPVKIEISIRDKPGAWKKIYESRSEEHNWMSGTFEKYRIRRIVFQMAWDKDLRHFKMFCDWVATQAARDFPSAVEVMVVQTRYRTPSPEEALAGKVALDPEVLARETRKLKGAK